MKRGFFILLLLTAVLSAQPFHCDWQVVAGGGGIMSGNYRCGATIGQTATGRMTGPNLLALVGFWQPEPATGLEERQQFDQQAVTPLVTRLYQPAPNPFFRRTQVCYSLAEAGPVSLQVLDLSGRVVRTLVNAIQKPGVYRLVWDGRDGSGRALAGGVYFCRFSAGAHRQTTKLLFGR
ncbi:MAG: T9SS type A sorting domain-containing protein [candidate division WOR-3 bacterium]|uniref:T9SS type A sorting domain-containing protein n=2 Tax=candidate division WOR-3 bacterium TaxID=2052148 RepID=A0A7C3F1E2_UNCW3|nr:T9SS type A sorting domain-containing protein [candidate division WOR-3 bacterium]